MADLDSTRSFASGNVEVERLCDGALVIGLQLLELVCRVRTYVSIDEAMVAGAEKQQVFVAIEVAIHVWIVPGAAECSGNDVALIANYCGWVGATRTLRQCAAAERAAIAGLRPEQLPRLV